MAERLITVEMTVTEALALERVADYGVRVAETLGLIQNVSTAERALRLVGNAARGIATKPSPARVAPPPGKRARPMVQPR